MPAKGTDWEEDLFLLAAVGVGLYLVYQVLSSVVSGVASTAGGIVSGNNALTAGTPYAGAGVLGTAGAAANTASGGALSAAGTSIGGALYNWLNPYDPNAPAASSSGTDSEGFTGTTGSW